MDMTSGISGKKSVSLIVGGTAAFRMKLTNKCHLLSDKSVGLRSYSVGWLSSCPYFYYRRDFARIALCVYIYIIVLISGVDLYSYFNVSHNIQF
jgi:hypothetical protein